MTRRFSVVARWAVAALLILLPGLARADGKLSGTITDRDGKGVGDVRIEMRPDGEGLSVLEAKSKKSGIFMFGMIRPGNYRLVAFKEGMRVARIDVEKREAPEKKPSWSAHADVPPGAELPAFALAFISEVTYDLKMTPSRTGPGKSGTGEPLATVDTIVKLVTDEKFDEAEREIERNLDEKPDSSILHYLRAYTLYSRGTNEEALVAIDKALALDAGFEGSSLLRGKILEKGGKAEQAAAAYQSETAVAKTKNGLKDAWLALAVIDEKLARKDQAAAALEKVVEIAPDYVDAYQELANLYMQMNRMDKVKEVNDRLRAQGQTEDPNLLFNLGAERFNKGDLKGAADYFSRVVQIKPDFAEAHLQLGYARINEGDLKGAAESLRKYLDLKPQAEDAKSVRELLDKISK
jgi:tetratricopeptide (TPR) repeat protein